MMKGNCFQSDGEVISHQMYNILYLWAMGNANLINLERITL